MICASVYTYIIVDIYKYTVREKEKERKRALKKQRKGCLYLQNLTYKKYIGGRTSRLKGVGLVDYWGGGNRAF